MSTVYHVVQPPSTYVVAYIPHCVVPCVVPCVVRCVVPGGGATLGIPRTQHKDTGHKDAGRLALSQYEAEYTVVWVTPPRQASRASGARVGLGSTAAGGTGSLCFETDQT